MATLALSGPSLIKAGAGVDAVMTASAGGEIDHFIEQAEDYLSALTKYDVVTDWITLSGPAAVMTEYCERSAAVEAIKYNMLGEAGTGFTRIEAEDRINVNIFRMEQIRKLLESEDTQNFLGV